MIGYSVLCTVVRYCTVVLCVLCIYRAPLPDWAPHDGLVYHVAGAANSHAPPHRPVRR
jgi:hypothetical protein